MEYLVPARLRSYLKQDYILLVYLMVELEVPLYEEMEDFYYEVK